MNKVYLVTWVSQNEACAIPFAKSEDAWKYVAAWGDSPQDENGNELTSWDGQEDLEVWCDKYEQPIYHLKVRTLQ